MLKLHRISLQAPEGPAGFTMVEMSIVVAIIAVIVGMTITSGITTLGSAKLLATQKKMATIDQALMAYRNAHDQLPCPSDLTAVQGSTYYGTANTSRTGGYQYCAQTPSGTPYGVRIANNSAGTAVAVAEGGVPVADLGLPYDFMYDGWGNRFRYAVDVYMAYTGLSGGSTGTPNNTNTFSGTQMGSPYGAITIQGDPSSSDASNYTRSNAAIYALVSHGPNGHGAFTANGTIMNAGSKNGSELDNCNCTSTGSQNSANSYAVTGTYVQEQAYTYNTSNPLYNFDDIVTFKERWQIQGPNDIWGNAVPRVYVADIGNNRIQAFDLNGNYISQFGSSGHSGGQFTNPTGLFIDSSNTAWVADKSYNRVEKIALSASGAITYIATIGTGSTSGSSSNGQFNGPQFVSVDNSGNIWVLDNDDCRVQEFNSSLNFVNGIGAGYNNITGSIGSCGTSPSQFAGLGSSPPYSTGAAGPSGMTIDPAGNIWVSDTNNNRLQEFSSSGALLAAYGGGGTACTSGTVPACPSGSATSTPISFFQQQGITSDRFGNIWIADTGNSRIVEISNAGAYLNSFTPSSSPNCVAVDPAGNVWVSFWGGNNMQKWTYTNGAWGTPTTYGSSGSGNGKFNEPFGLAIPQTGIANYSR